jgi:hypothetical protein
MEISTNIQSHQGYVQDILEQPKALNATLRGLQQIFDLKDVP